MKLNLMPIRLSMVSDILSINSAQAGITSIHTDYDEEESRLLHLSDDDLQAEWDKLFSDFGFRTNN
jgi:hypothetical protein